MKNPAGARTLGNTDEHAGVPGLMDRGTGRFTGEARDAVDGDFGGTSGGVSSMLTNKGVPLQPANTGLEQLRGPTADDGDVFVLAVRAVLGLEYVVLGVLPSGADRGCEFAGPVMRVAIASRKGLDCQLLGGALVDLWRPQVLRKGFWSGRLSGIVANAGQQHFQCSHFGQLTGVKTGLLYCRHLGSKRGKADLPSPCDRLLSMPQYYATR